MSSYITLKLKENGFNNVLLNDLSFINNYFQVENCNFSDYSFSVFYTWSIPETLLYKKINNGLILINATHNQINFLYPPLGINDEIILYDIIKNCIEIFSNIFKNIVNKNDCLFKIFSISEEKIYLFKKIIENKNYNLKIEIYEDLHDYIYDYESLINLKGKVYKTHRENINKFLRTYPNFEIFPINKDVINNLLSFLLEWYYDNKPKRKILISEILNTNIINPDKTFILETCQTKRILKNYFNLNLVGEYIKLYSKIVGFIIGEYTTTDTFTVLIEKVDKNFFGLSQFLFWHFLNSNKKVKFVNTSDDANSKGLQVLKQSYNPILLKKRYYVKIYK